MSIGRAEDEFRLDRFALGDAMARFYGGARIKRGLARKGRFKAHAKSVSTSPVIHPAMRSPERTSAQCIPRNGPLPRCRDERVSAQD